MALGSIMTTGVGLAGSVVDVGRTGTGVSVGMIAGGVADGMTGAGVMPTGRVAVGRTGAEPLEGCLCCCFGQAFSLMGNWEHWSPMHTLSSNVEGDPPVQTRSALPLICSTAVQD